MFNKIKHEPIKVLIADEGGQISAQLKRVLERAGFAVMMVKDGLEAKQKIEEWQPRFVLADLLLSGANALDLLEFIKSDKNLKLSTQLLVLSSHNSSVNVKNAFQQGAVDYVVKPYTPGELLNRLVFHLQKTRAVKTINEKDFHKISDSSLMLHLIDLILKQSLSKQSLDRTLFNLSKMVSLKMEGVRCSIVQYLDSQTGVVVTSNDDINATGIVLDLKKYPEILQCVNHNKTFAIENIEGNPDYAHITSHLKQIKFSSIIVSPVSRNHEIFGVVSLRLPASKIPVSDDEIRFLQIASHVISLVLNTQNFSEIKEYWHKIA